MLAAGSDNGNIAIHDIGIIDTSNIPGKKKVKKSERITTLTCLYQICLSLNQNLCIF